MNRVIMVIGTQGSGKTYVVKYIVKNYGFSAVHNEELFREYQKGERTQETTDFVYEEAERRIRRAFQSSGVVYEATGAKPQWRALYERLADVKPVVVMVECDFDKAKKRHEADSNTDALLVPKGHTEELYRMLMQSGVKPDFRIDNNSDFDNLDIQIDALMKELGASR